MPVTNAESELSFSALRRIKTWLRSTMSQKRTNHAMLMNIHCDRADRLDMMKVAREFVNRNERRQSMFGKY